MTKPPAGQNSKSFSVAPSPFNAIKLELAILIIVGGLMLMALDSITQDLLLQISLLFISGMLGMAWIMWRTYRLLKLHRDASTVDRDSLDNQI